MKIIFEGKKLSQEIRTKRCVVDRMTIRDAADQIGVSASTLSRIENERIPDIETFAAICRWIEKPMDIFFKTKKDITWPKKRN